MPNPKVGTVTPDVATAVKNAKSGQVTYRVDKAGIIHCTIGKATFEVNALKENLHALIADLHKAKPAHSKGQYLKRITLSSTMRSEEHTSELQSPCNLVCRLLLEKKKQQQP